jgi:predicted RNA-binding protein associated with RNAse of E/G family
MSSEEREALVQRLALESRDFEGTSKDPERNCWLVVHRHAHGVLPSEYDIRDVPEDLYLDVLARRRELS